MTPKPSQPLGNAQTLVPLLRRRSDAVFDDVDNEVRRAAREQHAVAHVLATLAAYNGGTRG